MKAKKVKNGGIRMTRTRMIATSELAKVLNLHNIETAIEKLEALAIIDLNNKFDDDVLGENSITDFVSIPDTVEKLGDLWWAISNAVETEINETLSAQRENYKSADEVWTGWCNEDFEGDFSSIQKIINEETTMAITHVSAWYSPRGFANEGTYLYGTIGEMEKFFVDQISGDANCGWGSVKHHRGLDTAAARCKKDARQDMKRHLSNAEISSISHSLVSEFR